MQTEGLTTANLADACLRLGAPVRCAPQPLRAARSEMKARGPARPVRHVGSVDVFLEAIEDAQVGDVLVVDNAGRLDEACLGDLIAFEAKQAGLAGIAIWGLHRDSDDIANIGLPIFSLGATPTGPQRLDPRTPDTFDVAWVGPHAITADDFVVADADGMIFLPQSQLDEIVRVAEIIRDTERRQAQAMTSGQSLRAQVRFDEYLSRRRDDPTYGLRQHLKSTGGAIEE